MSHWLNHDAMAIDRYARRYHDIQRAYNVLGAGITLAGGYGLYKASGASLSSSSKKYMPPIYRKRSRALSVYVDPKSGAALRPVKRRRTTSKRKMVGSSSKTLIKAGTKHKTTHRRFKQRSKRKYRSYRKNYRRFARKSWGLFQKLGILRTHETGISTTGVTDAGFIGHASFRPTSMVVDFFLVLLKTLHAQMGIHMNNQLEVPALTVGDSWEVYIKPSLGDAVALVSTGYAFQAGDTWLVIAQALMADVMSSIVSGDTSSTTIVGMNFTRSAGESVVRLNLVGSKVVVRSESWLKIQNQTVTTLGGEEDDVDRCPVLCHKYWGYGTGAFTNRLYSTEAQLVQNQSTGVITKVGTVASGLSEAPPKSYFTGCKAKKRFILAPGHFASSKAYFNTAVPIEKFWALVCSQYTSTSVTNYYPYGSWNLFHFEHLIKPKATTANLIVNGEVNFRTGYYLTVKKYHNTDERVDTSTYVTY